MKLIHDNQRIIATATDSYAGPQPFIDAPIDFDVARLDEYRIIDGEVVLAAPRKITRLAFRNRFTQVEKVSIYTAAEASPALRVFIDDIAAAEYVDLDDPSVVAGVESLEVMQILEEGRAVEVLA